MELDDIHELLESLESTISQLAAEEREFIKPTEAGELCLIIGEIMGWGSAYASEFPQLIGVSKSTLTRFLRLNGSVSTNESRVIADRIRTYLRSLDQRTEAPTAEKPQNLRGDVTASSIRFDVPAKEWRITDAKGELKLKIAAVSSILDSIIEQTAHANCPESEQALTQIERQQLIAVLETALSVLRSPMVEKGLLEKARDMLRNAADEAAKKGVQQGFGEVAQNGVSWLTDLIGSLFS